MRVNSVPVSLASVGKMCPWTTAPKFNSDDNCAEQDNYTVEKILARRLSSSSPGGLEFKVRWRGYGPSHDT